MQIHQLKDLLKDFDKNVIYDQDLKKKNWFNIGGKSKVFYKAENLRDLVKFLKLLDNKSQKTKYKRCYNCSDFLCDKKK